MPLYDLGCPNCDFRRPDKFFHHRPKPNDMPVCPDCGNRLAIEITSAPVPLTKTFSEDHPRVDMNIRPDGKPQVITSWEQRRKLMKQFHLEEVGEKRGMPGSWA
jgi:hypothetical protein